MKSTVAPYQTVAWCVRITCGNGTVLRFTTYPFDLVMSNATVYETDSGYEATALQATSGFSPSAIDIEGFAGVGGVTYDQIASGLFDGARIEIFKCNYLAPVEDYEPVTAGLFGKTSLVDGRYRVEGMSLVDPLNQSVGRIIAPGCAWTFGSPQCGIDLATLDVTGTLTAVTSGSAFADSARAEAAEYFTAGTIHFTTGENAGHKALEIKSFAAGAITTHEPFYWQPAIGDAYVMIPGCRKRLDDCKAWNNETNHGGFPMMPLASTYIRVGGT